MPMINKTQDRFVVKPVFVIIDTRSGRVVTNHYDTKLSSGPKDDPAVMWGKKSECQEFTDILNS